MPSVLIVGATRGLGHELTKHYHALNYTVYGTSRSSSPSHSPHVHWLSHIDLVHEHCGTKLASTLTSLSVAPLDIIILTAGYFATETFEAPNFHAQQTMYTTSAIAPTLIVSALSSAKLLKQGTKLILVSSESGSITLRHESEGGGNFGHHASKAASNMVGKLLSLDLKDQGVAVGIVHPGFMRTEMTKGVGFDKYWDAGGGESDQIFSVHFEIVQGFADESDTSRNPRRSSQIIGRVRGYL